MNRLNKISNALSSTPSPVQQKRINSMEKEQEVLRYRNYSYCIAKPHHKQQLFQLNIEARIKWNPFVCSYSLFKPEINPWVHQTLYWNVIFGQITSNNLGIVCLDRNKNNQIVATICGISSASKNDPYTGSQGYEYFQTERAFTAELMKTIPTDISEKMKQKEKVYKLTAGASRPTLQERGVFGKTIPLAIQLARKAGFKYVFSYCGIIQSRKACMRAGLIIIAEGDLKTFEYKGQKTLWFGVIEKSAPLSDVDGAMICNCIADNSKIVCSN